MVVVTSRHCCHRARALPARFYLRAALEGQLETGSCRENPEWAAADSVPVVCTWVPRHLLNSLCTLRLFPGSKQGIHSKKASPQQRRLTLVSRSQFLSVPLALFRTEQRRLTLAGL